MKSVYRKVAAWFLACVVFVAVVTAGLAALGLLIVAVPLFALIGRAFPLKRTSYRPSLGRVLEGEYRIVGEPAPQILDP